MAGAFVDGALKGFEMMDRHLARKDNKARLADLDERNDQRYQDSLDRQAKLDEERKDNREQDVTYRKDQAKATANYRKSTLEANQLQRQWQQNYQTQQANWQKDQPAIAMAWQTWRETGKIPEDLEPVMQRNKSMDPRTYAKPEVRENIKTFKSFLGEVAKTGDIAQLNSPKSLELTNLAFGDKINSTVGQYNETVKSKVASNKIVNYVPLSEKGEPPKFGFEIEVTYENGMKERKPMTKGRTSDPEDPVMTYTPKELFGTVNTRAMMADMIERPEYWDKMGAEVAANFGRGTKASSSRGNDYQKQLNSIQDEMTKALAKIEGGSDLDYLEDGGREAAKQRVKDLYQSRINQLQNAYGIESSGGDNGGGGSQSKYTSKIDGIDAGGVIKKFMEANKNLTEQQATQIAIQQGYLSNDQ